MFNVLSTAGASILGFGMLIPAIYFVWSMRYGRRGVESVALARARSGARNRRRQLRTSK